MSSVIVAIDESQIIIGTDTLCVSHVGESSFFGTKALLVPHMNMVIAASGACSFMEHWWQYLNERKVYPGIETLSWSASEDLSKLWKAWKQDHPWPAGIEHEQAIYHFGVSELTGEMLAYAHVSWDGFAAEEMSFRVRSQAMVFAKPNCTMPSVEAMSEFPRLFVPMMEEQRTLQATKGYGPDHSGQVTIGGELIVHHLNAYGCSVYKLARFDDYAAVETGLWGDFRAKYAAAHPAASEPVHVLPDACVVAAEVEAERVRGEEFAQALVAAAAAAGKSPEQWSRDVLVDAVVRSVSTQSNPLCVEAVRG